MNKKAGEVKEIVNGKPRSRVFGLVTSKSSPDEWAYLLKMIYNSFLLNTFY